MSAGAMRGVRMTLWALVGVAVLGAAWMFAVRSQATAPPIASYGVPFTATLAGAGGTREIKRADILGRPHAMFFGFTHCPDVCPTTLYETSQWLEALGSDADELDVYFVTVDPARDTAEARVDYLRPFDRRIKAITGSQAEIDKMIEGWNVVAKKVPLDDGGYNVDHTASTFLMRADGSLQGTIAYQENADTAVAKLKRLIEG